MVGLGYVPAREPPAAPAGVTPAIVTLEAAVILPSELIVSTGALVTPPYVPKLTPVAAMVGLGYEPAREPPAAPPGTPPEIVELDTAVILPSEPTVIVGDVVVPPYVPAVAPVAAMVGLGYEPDREPPAAPLGAREFVSLVSLPNTTCDADASPEEATSTTADVPKPSAARLTEGVEASQVEPDPTRKLPEAGLSAARLSNRVDHACVLVPITSERAERVLAAPDPVKISPAVPTVFVGPDSVTAPLNAWAPVHVLLPESKGNPEAAEIEPDSTKFPVMASVPADER